MEKSRKELSRIRRRNAKLYPVYKMVSWDLLFFYSIEFLFYTIVKKLSASEILVINGLYLFFRVVMQIPSVTIIERIGRKKSIILGNFALIIYIIVLINVPGAKGVIIADMIWAFGYSIKLIAEPGLLYDSVSTRGGEGLYSKIDAKGGSFHFILDGIASLTAGYLFVYNNYVPMYVCLCFIVISFLLSFGFKDVYKANRRKTTFKEQVQDIKDSFKFAKKSKRLKALILFQIVFYSLSKVIVFYNSDLLVEIGVPEEQFSMIFASFTLIGGIALSLKESIERAFKNRTLAFISLVYIFSCLLIGIITKSSSSPFIIPIILILLAIMQSCVSIWYILEAKYLKNFTKAESRNKIAFAYEFTGGAANSIISILGGVLLNFVAIQDGFVIVGLVSLLCITLVLEYMKTRIGLKPEEYRKDDIEF